MKTIDSQVDLLRVRGCISCIHFLLVFGFMPALVLAVDELPVILCPSCHQVEFYYYSVMEGETLTCSFTATTQVQLEWFQQSSDGYDHVEMQSFNITENESGTYKSLATLQLLDDDDNLIHSLVCRATQLNSDWRREKEILVDISRNESFSDIEPETQYMDLNTSPLILCGGLSSSYMIWKKIIPSDNPELVGFHSHIMTRTTTSAQDIDVSADDGSLVFHYIGVHNEGIYACISGDGLSEEINVTSVKILIPPSPPYISITGCDDVYQRCLLRENTTKELECAVYGVRPTATLEWIAEDTNQISFSSPRMDSKKKGDTFDTILSVEYEVSKDVLCGEEISVQCNPHEPLSELIEAEARAFILPASCKKIEAAHSGLSSAGITLLVLFSFPIVVLFFGMLYEVSKLRSLCKKLAEGDLFAFTRIGVRVGCILGIVSWMVLEVFLLWPIWKESDETAIKRVLVALLVSCAVVTLVLLVNVVLALAIRIRRSI